MLPTRLFWRSPVGSPATDTHTTGHNLSHDSNHRHTPSHLLWSATSYAFNNLFMFHTQVVVCESVLCCFRCLSGVSGVSGRILMSADVRLTVCGSMNSWAFQHDLGPPPSGGVIDLTIAPALPPPSPPAPNPTDVHDSDSEDTLLNTESEREVDE
jgi:hypothetical protein